MQPSSSLLFRSRAGYSMVEILTVLVILGILTMIAMRKLSSFTGVSRRQGALGQVVADVGFTRMAAIRSGNVAKMTLNSTGTEYTVGVRDETGAYRTVKTVKISMSYPGVTVTPVSDSLVFDGRGLRRSSSSNSTLYVSQTVGSVTTRDSIVISPIGKVNRVR